ncbi:MAG: ABC transporter ATP-binding protein [Eubacteriales bacterium]|nr:ABC transporter ATP-binding protein [Eubacteriales bacterium]MDD4389752.1 ABC transporter ATP-binding protein [Eubacteriales bacterium]
MNNEMKAKKDTVRRLLSYMKNHKIKLFIVVICIVINAIASVKSATFLETLIDDHILPMLVSGSNDFSGLFNALIYLAMIFAIGIAANLVYHIIMVVVSQKTLKKIRDEMFEKMQTLPIKYFDTNSHGDIMSRYTNDADTLRNMIAESLPQILSVTITIMAIFIAMLAVSIPLTVFIIISVLLMMLFVKNTAGKSGSYFIKQQQSLGDLNGYVEEIVNGLKVVKVFSYEEKSEEIFDGKNEIWRDNATNANTYASIIMPVMQGLSNVQYVFLAIIGGYMAINAAPNFTITGVNVLTLGMIAAFLTLAKNFTNPISHISSQVNSIVMAIAGASRIFDLMDEEIEKDEGDVILVNVIEHDGGFKESQGKTGIWAWKCPSDAGEAQYIRVRGHVVLENVNFGYTEDKMVLKDISVYAKSGEKVAFVGATGAGKTTITNLINRFYDIDDGKISYDGIDIKRIRKQDLRRSLGVVLQEVNLFTGTVMENIRYGNVDATDEECIAAAKLANADNFIRMLPNGYETVLEGDGSGLSQGQRQLISIARAAVADPPVMILDEATSSIDTRTELLVQRGMDKLMEGRSVFVIAHRLSTVRNSDVIMVMENGSIIERGNHDQLIEQKGKYYQLYMGAFELE